MVKKFLQISNDILMFFIAAKDQEFSWTAASPTSIGKRVSDHTWWHIVSSPMFYLLFNRKKCSRKEKKKKRGGKEKKSAFFDF